MCVLYLNGFSNASGRVFVAQGQPHSQFNSSGVAQSALLGTSGCYSSRKPGWLCVIAEWNTAFQVHNRPRLDYCPRILCKFSLLPLWWWRAVKSELTTQLWCFNVKKLKNPRRTSDLLLFASFCSEATLPFFLLNLLFQQSQKKFPPFGFLVHLYWLFNGWSLKLVA